MEHGGGKQGKEARVRKEGGKRKKEGGYQWPCTRKPILAALGQERKRRILGGDLIEYIERKRERERERERER